VFGTKYVVTRSIRVSISFRPDTQRLCDTQYLAHATELNCVGRVALILMASKVVMYLGA